MRRPFVIPEIEFRAGDGRAAQSRRARRRRGGHAPLRILFAQSRDFGDGVKRRTSPAGSGHWLFPRRSPISSWSCSTGVRCSGAGPARRRHRGPLPQERPAAAVSEALRGAGVPSVALGDASVFESPEARMLEHVLRALAEPGDALALRVALVTPLIGLRQRAHSAPQRRRGGVGCRGASASSAGTNAGGRAASPPRCAACSTSSRRRRRPGEPRGERRMTNLLHLGELLQQAASESRRGPHGLVDWLHRLRTIVRCAPSSAAEAAQIRLESDVHAVR
jgi:exodeoxyribonuclease V beta subunit